MSNRGKISIGRWARGCKLVCFFSEHNPFEIFLLQRRGALRIEVSTDGIRPANSLLAADPQKIKPK
jgi:hypothetical protein